MRTKIASCTTLPLGELSGEFRLLPAGLFRTIDGRPYGLPGWSLDQAAALQIVRLANARVSDYVIDYDHQTLNVAKNGAPAPAAGWFKRLEWREGDGLYVTDARWTERATALLKAKEYRFISPVFTYGNRGEVIDLLNAALTNNPALDGLTELAAASRLPSHAGPAEIARAALAYQESMTVQGKHVTTLQAVAHVTPAAVRENSSPAPAPAGVPQEIAGAAIDYQSKMAKLGVHVTTVQAVGRVCGGTGAASSKKTPHLGQA